MLNLRQSLPATIAMKPDVKRMLFSSNDTPEVLKENVCAAVGLHPALKPAVCITNTKPLVPLGSIEGRPDLTDTDSAIKALEILLMETGREDKWRKMRDVACNVVVDCLPDGTVKMLRYMCASQELKQTHRLVADQTALTISFKPLELPPSVFIVKHGVKGHVFELEPHKTVGNLQACCADIFNVPIESQARSVWLSRLAPHPLTSHLSPPHPSPLTPSPPHPPPGGHCR